MQGTLIFEKGAPGRRAAALPETDVAERDLESLIPTRHVRRTAPDLPEVSEVELVRHYTRLSQTNMSVDTAFYPLGSCTMKYNPKINEDLARLPGFAEVHPYQPEQTTQGLLRLLWEMEQMLKEITGMARFTLQPAAGAQGELVGLMLVQAYHRSKGQRRHKVIVPDSSHGTNPASATLCGFEVVSVPSTAQGTIDVEALRRTLDEDVAALMMTNPNTLGLFENQILDVERIVHARDALLYYDGANLNALLGVAKPSAMGFDIVHLNLHKTFSTPHGGGGPGAGPVGVVERLERFLPVPLVSKSGDTYVLDDNVPNTIGRVHAFYGNIGVVVRAYAYIKALGGDGLARVGRAATVNANYLLSKLGHIFRPAGDGHCMHEFVLSASRLKEYGVTLLDLAKALIDTGFHPPTVYFPLIVEDALMIEPTETETKETLDGFVEAIVGLVDKAQTDPDALRAAPVTTPVRRLDEVSAARHPILRWKREG